eukprot:12123459-Heterocapsa_arctica.AAC.1
MKPTELKQHLVEVVKARLALPRKLQMALVEHTAMSLCSEGQLHHALTKVLQLTGSPKQDLKFDPLDPVLGHVDG